MIASAEEMILGTDTGIAGVDEDEDVCSLGVSSLLASRLSALYVPYMFITVSLKTLPHLPVFLRCVMRYVP